MVNLVICIFITASENFMTRMEISEYLLPDELFETVILRIFFDMLKKKFTVKNFDIDVVELISLQLNKIFQIILQKYY